MTDETEMAIRALEARIELQETRIGGLQKLVQAVADEAEARIELQDARVRASRELVGVLADKLEVTERMLAAHAADLERASGAADDLQAQLSQLKRLAP